ncbi:MAG: hypothetical protein RI964_40 [Pseudomonadota bacterium]|jgi:CRISPR-associated protein Csb2
MAWLSIYVRYLNPTYHGFEYPPSPFKLMQALISGFNHGRDRTVFDADFERAIRWFETVSPTWITAPEIDDGLSLNLYVPNNEDNLTMQYWQLADDKVLEKKRDRYSAKSQRQRILGGNQKLSYHWEVLAQDLESACAIAAYAKTITALGLGIDMVIAYGEVQEQLPVLNNLVYQRCEMGNIALNIPILGSYVSLEARYYAKFMGKPSNAWVNTKTARYQRADQPVSKPYIAFELRQLSNQQYWTRDVRLGDEVCAMVRHNVNQILHDELMDADEVAQWLGHGDPNGKRLQIVPLPSIGHEYVDGLIRRVMIIGTDAALLERLAWSLDGSELQKDGQATTRLVRIFGDDKMLARYTAVSLTQATANGAHEWVSVTPVVLPGFDHGGKRTARLLHKALYQAGLPEPVAMQVSNAPNYRHGYRAGSYAVPEYLKQYPQYHVWIKWEHPQVGAIAIGAGRFRGLGLLCPCANL